MKLSFDRSVIIKNKLKKGDGVKLYVYGRVVEKDDQMTVLEIDDIQADVEDVDEMMENGKRRNPNDKMGKAMRMAGRAHGY